MRYITKRLNKSMPAELSEVDVVIFQSLDLEYVISNRYETEEDLRSLFYVKNDIDISLLSSEFLNLFDIVELSADEAIQFVENYYVDYEVFIDENEMFVMKNTIPEHIDPSEFVATGEKPVFRRNPDVHNEQEEFHE